MNYNPMQQQQIQQLINKELETVTVSWTTEMKEWHPIALEALKNANLAELNVAAASYERLLTSDNYGINAMVVATLANNIERRSPYEMNATLEEMNQVLLLNQSVAEHWESFVGPIRDKVVADFEKGVARQQKKIITMNTVKD